LGYLGAGLAATRPAPIAALEGSQHEPGAIMSRAAWATGATLAGLLLAGCTGSQPAAPPPCPTVLVLKGAERTAGYRPGANPRPADLEYLAVLTDLVSVCRYDDAGVDVGLRFNLIAEQGPAFATGPLRLSYFVATLAPDQTVLSKNVFVSHVAFPAETGIAGNAEQMTVRMPGVEPDAGAGYRVYLGFQLDDAEMRRRLQATFR
jgi:hypothetical protein